MPQELPVGVVETHCAVVVFMGDRAYKVKKPVDLGFLDFTTRKAREEACHREVELNRRLAPDVYLGVADVLGPDGQPADHMVVMRRMPEDRRLATLLAEGHAVDGCVRAVARQVAVLHAAAATSRDDLAMGAVATRDAVAGNWQDNLDAMAPFVGDVLDAEEFARVQWLAQRYLAGRRALFDQRIHDGQVRDGHGDLLAEDVFCLDDGPRILDCLEFDDRYRYGDVLLDAAFLAMDLERLGHPEVARRFLRWYAEFSGSPAPTSLTEHYVAYRAHVRAKVACLRHAQGGAGSAEEARRLHRLALDHLQPARTVLLLVGGLPGTGKSTVAGGLAETHRWALLRSDEVRKDLASLGHRHPRAAAPDEGLYRPDLVAQVYDEVLDRARRLLAKGESVVVDASWTSAHTRRAAADVARATHSDLVQIDCRVAADVARARLASRGPGSDPSDATQEVFEAMANRADPWPDATVIATGRPIDGVLAEARQAVQEQLEELLAQRP